METCETCGADLKGDSGCTRCLAIFARSGVRPGGVNPFREWLEDVIATRIRAFIDAGHLSGMVDAQIDKAIDRHEGRYYHNRRPDY